MLIPLIFLIIASNSQAKTLNLWTKTAKFENVVVIEDFWKSTGLSPTSDQKSRSDFLLSNDEKLNLDYIGSLPNRGIKMIRIHWLLDIVTVSEVRSGKPIFHLENLDRLIDRLYRNGLNPSFELMGNPSNYFHNFNTQSKHWIELIRQIIHRYSNLYGADYVGFWRFELMNEPDLKQYNFFNFTLQDYINYFKASEEAVARLAGPAGLFRHKQTHPLCWGLLDYCNSNPCNLNMITFHRKGGEVGSEVVDEGLELINSIISEFPNLKKIPFGNDEADIMTGWNKPLEWRADVRYAALVIQVIIGHIEEMMIKRNIPFELLSNDNAFLSFSPNYFTQRTLLARFQMNNTKPSHVQYFRKPVYSVMGLLSLLGNYLKDIRYQPGENGYSYVMTSHKYQDTFLGVVTNDKVTNESYEVSAANYVNVNVRIALGNLSVSGVSLGYLMDNLKTNPYQVWKDGGSPDFPNATLRRQIRKAEGFHQLFVQKIKPNKSHIKFYLENVSVPSIFAVNVCFEGTEEPGSVSDLHFSQITQNEILLMWKDTLVESRCILTYTVEFKGIGDSEFRRVNSEDTIFLSYHFDGLLPNGTEVSIFGEYRVAAVDYWNRRGEYSDILTVNH